MREVVDELGADLTESTNLSKIAQHQPGPAVTIRSRNYRDMARLVGVPESPITNVNLTSMNFACNRLAGEFLESEVHRCFDEGHAAELHITAREDLASDGAGCANHEIGANTKDGVIRRLKERIQALRSTVGPVPGNVRSAALARCAIGLGCDILRRETANDEIGDAC